MEFRPAKASDLLEFMPEVPCSCRAVSAIDDGVVYGVGGIYYVKGRVVAFSHLRSDISKRDTIRGALAVMNIVKETVAPVFAYPGIFDSAPGTLKHFGFEPIDGSDWYIWRAAA